MLWKLEFWVRCTTMQSALAAFTAPSTKKSRKPRTRLLTTKSLGDPSESRSLRHKFVVKWRSQSPIKCPLLGSTSNPLHHAYEVSLTFLQHSRQTITIKERRHRISRNLIPRSMYSIHFDTGILCTQAAPVVVIALFVGASTIRQS